MPRPIHGSANRAYRAGDPGGGFVVYDAHRLDLMAAILAQLGLDYLGIDTMPPVCLYDIDIQAQLGGHSNPQGGKLADLEHQDLVAGREGIGERTLPGS